MKHGWRELFYFSKAGRRAVMLLAGMCMGVAVTSVLFLWKDEAGPVGTGNRDAVDYDDFMAGIQHDTIIRKNVAQSVAHDTEKRPELFVFDPNTADSAALIRLGLRPWQVRNLCKYRIRGGRFHRPEDFAKLYGLSSEEYERLRPYISIAEDYKSEMRARRHELSADTAVRFIRQEKFSEGVTVDLNEADTITLKKVPGIGSYYARRITDYRNRLGGFVSVEQLSELEGISAETLQWFTVEPSVFRPLYINRMSVEELRRHPYLSFYQSRVLVEHRRKYGPMKKLQALSLYGEFTPADLERLQPYVSFEE